MNYLAVIKDMRRNSIKSKEFKKVIEAKRWCYEVSEEYKKENLVIRTQIFSLKKHTLLYDGNNRRYNKLMLIQLDYA